MEQHLIPTSSRFFKVLIPGFHRKLNLPVSFCEKLKEEKSEWAMLKSRIGTWKIGVRRSNVEGVISFEVGWPLFVDHHNLGAGDFLVFEHVGSLNFNVLVFDRSACEREFLIESKEDSSNSIDEAAGNPSKDNERETKKECVVISFDRRNPHFITTMARLRRASRYARLNIPMEFARSNNLANKRSSIVTLRNDRGRVWLTSLLRTGVSMYLQGKGWREFYECNELKAGDVCTFYLNPNSALFGTILFDVKIAPCRR